MSDNLRKRRADEIGKAAIRSANLAVKRDRQEDVIERIDKVTVALLRARNDVEKLIELLFVGRNRVALFDAANQAPQLGNFLGALPCIQSKQSHQYDQSNR